MTKISYIHGPVPVNEYSDRAAEVKPAAYFNPLVMTEGGAYLTLMRDQVKVLSEYYPENKTYRKGLSLIDNQLYRGIHGPTIYMGSVEPQLYPVARAIDVYKAQRQPATMPRFRPGVGAASWQDESMIGVEIKQLDQFALWWIQQDRVWLTSFHKGKAPSVNSVLSIIDAMKHGAPVGKEFITHYNEFVQKYDSIKYIIDLYNNTLEKFAHHPLYNFLPQNNDYPSSVVMKNIWHSAGVQACANTGEFSVSNMSLWTRNSILRANIAGNVGAISPEQTAFVLSGLPDSEFGAFLGAKGPNRGRPGADKADKMNGASIGILPVVLAGIIALIGTAIAAAAQMYTAAQQRKAAAFAGVQGWGTQAYSANEADWKGYGPPPGGPPATAEAGTNWPLIIGGGAAAAWLLTSK